ncbi:MAG: prepilin peptidase [Burkholderiales bacterium]|nr:prepilin peptidase [Burkholderiales bacterium]
MNFLTPALLANGVIALLCTLLLAAVWTDVRSHRIPNRLVFAGAALGLVFNGVLPEGFGFVSILPGALGFWPAMAGLGLGTVLTLPMYMAGAMGAGDVKLVAMVGAFLGPYALLASALLIFIAGGVLAATTALGKGNLNLLLGNVRYMVMSVVFKTLMHEIPKLDAAPVSAGKMPYAIAVAAGTISYVVLASNRYLDFFRFIYPNI